MNFRLVFCSHYVIRLIGFIFVFGATVICFSGVTYNADKLGLDSIQYNVMFLSVVEAICYIITSGLISWCPRKLGSLIC